MQTTHTEHTASAQARACVIALTTAVLMMWLAAPSHAHDPKRRNRKPTKAAPALKEARQKMDAAKATMAEKGKYDCCVKPSCDMCARTHGACACGSNVADGKGACGECMEGWLAGLGAVKGAKTKTINLLPTSEHKTEEDLLKLDDLVQACHQMNEAKRAMVSEGRYSCCVRGGCDSCAHGADCQCGSELARLPSNGDAKSNKQGGVCGECLDGWRSGQGVFAGVAAEEVKLEQMGMSSGMMSGQGSGTSRQPDSTPARGWFFTPGNWLIMLHGDFKVGFNHQGGPRGIGKAESQNWLMVMADRDLGPGRLSVRGMFSAEPLTAPHGGFPLLFQSGETYRRQGIIDAQHPHDLFMELAAKYTIPISENFSFDVYGGPVGEPALGPTAFMHRASAAENPAAPLGHHWQDSTHIAHGVVTTALNAWRFKLEASAFHGREPDEDRAGIELGKLDSYSFRVSYAPTANWAMQASFGHLYKPEALFPTNINRTTASISYNRPLARGNWASSLIWGRDDEPLGDTNAYLFESTLNFLDRNYFYTRLELVDKVGLYANNIFGRPGLGGCEIRLPPVSIVSPAGNKTGPFPIVKHHFPGQPVQPGQPANPCLPILNTSHRIGAFTFGGVRDLIADGKVRIGLGADTTFYHKPVDLDPVYGIQPVSFRVFLRFRLDGAR
jgi:hypothetical protein